MSNFVDNLEGTMDYTGYYAGHYLTYAILAAFAVVLVLYLLAENKNRDGENFKKATALKLALSGMFCAVGVISLYLLWNFSTWSTQYFYFQVLVVIGLFFAVGGDYFLQFIRLDNKKYRAGIGFFMVTQILLIASMCILNKVGWVEFVVMAALLGLVLLLMKKQNWQLGPERKIVTVYTVLIAFMASKAAVTAINEKLESAVIFAAGAALFLLSDVLLGVWNYHSGKRVHANLNWITYFSGMMLIALSVSPDFLIYISY